MIYVKERRRRPGLFNSTGSAASETAADPRERGIVFLEDIGKLDYVRVGLECTYSPVGPVHRGGDGRTVGYATLPADAGGRCFGPFRRRVFYLLDIDRDGAPDGIYADGVPAGAVDPRTIRPGRAGELTARALGRVEEPRRGAEDTDEQREGPAAVVYELDRYRRFRRGGSPVREHPETPSQRMVCRACGREAPSECSEGSGSCAHLAMDDH